MKTLQELLQARAALHEQQTAFLAKVDTEGVSAWTTEATKAFDDREAQIKALDTEIDAREGQDRRVAAVRAREAALDNPVTPTRRPDLTVHNRAGDRPWNHIGEMMQAVKAAAEPGVEPRHWDPRLKWQSAATGHGSSNPSEGGFLIGTGDTKTLYEVGMQASQLAGRCSSADIGEGFDSTSIPAYDMTSLATGSLFGGVTFYWREDAATVDPSKLKFRTIDLKLKGMMALVYATDEILRDAVAMRSYILRAFPIAFARTLDDSIFSGNGAGKPLGITASPAFISVAKENGQAATTIVKENIDKMWSRCYVENRRNAAWFINQDCEPALDSLNMAVGTGGAPVYLPPGGISAAPYATLKGRPVIPIPQCETLGTLGDIVLADFSAYALAQKDKELAMAESMHVRFLYAENVFRFMYRVNGEPLWNRALTPPKGSNSLSPFVGLAARA